MDMLKDLKLGTSCKPKYIQIADCFIDNVSRENLRKTKNSLCQ
jgi:hypothetical protein